MAPHKELPPRLLETVPWEQSAASIWLASSLILSRNVKGLLFPGKLSEKESLDSKNFLESILLSAPAFKNHRSFTADELSSIDREYLSEHFLYKDSLQHPSPAQSLIVDETGQLFLLINFQNHISIELIDGSGELKLAWDKLSSIERSLEGSLAFSFSQNFGFLTSNPMKCGTALQVSLYLHLPALYLTETLFPFLENANQHAVAISSLEGSLDEFLGDIIVLQNRYTLGTSEEEILHLLQLFATELIKKEKEQRESLLKKNNPIVEDQIHRAFGLLTCATLLQTKETLNNLSALKLGVSLGKIQGISEKTITRLMFQCRRAHLAKLSHDFVPEDWPQKRADMIRASIETATLKK